MLPVRNIVQSAPAASHETGSVAAPPRPALERHVELAASATPKANSPSNRDTVESASVTKSQRYLLVSPCRDEAQYIRRTLDSVAAQSVTPALWIVVDDGSTDGTTEILEDYARKLPYLRVVKRTDRGHRQVGPGVIDAFYAGLAGIRLGDFDYVCKLDVDLDLPVRYFETLMERMEADPRLGTASGKPWFVHPQTGKLVPEVCGDEMSVGMTKFYRVACFEEIGGFVRQVMWDGIDCHRARMLGWVAESVDAEPLRFIHLRPQGASQKNILTGRVRAGFGQYFMGTAPLYYLVAVIYRLPSHPAVFGSLAMLWGYLKSWAKGLPRYDDPEFRRFLRSYQYACLRKGKRAATARADAERAPIWHERHTPADTSGMPAKQMHRKAELLGLKFDVVTMESAVARCLELCRGPRRSHTVMTANASHLCMMRRDASLAQACMAADVTVADGMSVVWALQASGQSMPERVAGIDLMANLLAAAEANGLSVYFLGARRDVVTTLVERARLRHPALKIAGFRDGYFGSQDHPAIVEEIRASGADMLFIGMPSPFKEMWSEQHRERLDVPLIMGVGGSFDVLAGFIQRAPQWVQVVGFEWFWRLLMEPRKLWKRYLVTNTEFIWLAGREIISRRFDRAPPSGPTMRPTEGGS